MNILLCSEFYAPSVGGVQEVMRQLAERFVARGHAVTVATTALPQRTFTKLHGVTIREFAISGNLVRGMTGDLDAYRRFVIEQAFDVVMIKAAQQWTFDALWPVLDRISGGKVFIPCGFSSLYEPAYAGYFDELPAVLKQFDHLIFYASDYRDIRFAKQCGLTNMSIIPNGASESEFGGSRDRSFRKRHGVGEEDLFFLSVGSPAKMKGHYELAEAFLKADFSGRPAVLMLNAGASLAGLVPPSPPAMPAKVSAYWRAVNAVREQEGILSAIMHVGHGVLNKLGVRLGRYAGRAEALCEEPQNTFQAIREAIERQANGKRVMLTDFPRPDLVQAYMNADLFVFASHVEYSPLVLFEAAAAGTPFLSVPVGNAREIAGWPGGGEICQAPQDERGYVRVVPAVFAEQWSRLARDRAHLQRMGQAGKSAWSARFTWERIADQYERIFQKVAIHA